MSPDLQRFIVKIINRGLSISVSMIIFIYTVELNIELHDVDTQEVLMRM